MTRVRPVEDDDRLAAAVVRSLGEGGIDLLDDPSVDLVAIADSVDHGVARAGLLARRDGRWLLRTSEGPAPPDIVESLARHAVELGGGEAQWFVTAATDAHRAIAEHLGLEPERVLFQMRCDLPLAEHATVAVRPYDAERDRDAWIEVNNRAFAWHPDQAGMTIEAVLEQEQQPWFDADGFLLHEVDGELAAFCWTKVHLAHDPPLGEIYVIAADPDQQGRGLGRELTLAGLDYLSASGLDVGMLYVESDNDAAVGLYRALGFSVHQEDVFFTGAL